MRIHTCDSLDLGESGTEGLQPLHNGLLTGNSGGGQHPLLHAIIFGRS